MIARRTWAGVFIGLLPVASAIGPGRRCGRTPAPPRGTGAEDRRPRAQARDPGREREGRPAQHAGRSRPARRASPSPPRTMPTSSGFGGLVHFDGRYYLDDAGLGGSDSWRAPARPPHARRDALQLRGLPLHAGLRPGPQRHPGRLGHRPLPPGLPGHGRQVQVARGPRAPAVGQRHPLPGPGLPHAPRPEPGPGPAGRRQLPPGRAHLPGRVPQRLQRRRQQRDLRRRGRERRQGVGPAALLPSLRQLRRTSTSGAWASAWRAR